MLSFCQNGSVMDIDYVCIVSVDGDGIELIVVQMREEMFHGFSGFTIAIKAP
jgi:hypothetical protein